MIGGQAQQVKPASASGGLVAESYRSRYACGDKEEDSTRSNKLAGVMVALSLLALGCSGGPSASPPDSPQGTRCTRVTVACPSIPDSSARLRVNGQAGPGSRGTILLTTGDTGTFFYRELSRYPASRFPNLPPNPSVPPGAEKAVGALIAALVTDGFLAVELAWDGQGLWDEPGGPRTMVCRFAPVARWVYDNLHSGGARTLFAAQGTSGGASMIAFALAHYGLDEILDLANLCGGPPPCPRRAGGGGPAAP